MKECMKCERPVRSNDLCNKHYLEQRRRDKGIPEKTPKPPIKFFLENVVTYPKSCWEWKGRKDRNGYALIQIYDPEKQLASTHVAHRWIWQQFNGPVPEGLELDHLCLNRGCVRPSHLEPVTHQENCRRAWAWRKELKLQRPPRTYELRECSVDGCYLKHNAKGLCRKHYLKMRYHLLKQHSI